MKLIIHSGQKRQERLVAEKVIKRSTRKRTLEVEQMVYT